MLVRLALFAALALPAGIAPAGDLELGPAEMQRLHDGEILIESDLDAAQRRGTVDAALIVDAPPAMVFDAMIRCDDALEYVPHLRRCRLVGQPDPAVRLVEHEIDFGWYAPRIEYTIRADLEPGRSITFRQVHGDFRVNEGRWEFEADASGERTLLRYRVHIDPPGYVPNWLARSTFRKELPRMLSNLRRHCEAEQVLRAHTSTRPR